MSHSEPFGKPSRRGGETVKKEDVFKSVGGICPYFNLLMSLFLMKRLSKKKPRHEARLTSK